MFYCLYQNDLFPDKTAIDEKKNSDSGSSDSSDTDSTDSEESVYSDLEEEDASSDSVSRHFWLIGGSRREYSLWAGGGDASSESRSRYLTSNWD